MPPSDKKTLKELVEDKLKSGNATQLGDPVSLKAETADSEPTPDDRGAGGSNAKTTEGKSQGKKDEEGKSAGEKNASPGGKGAGVEGGKSLKQVAEEQLKTNPSMLGDPVSLKAEKGESEPTGDDRGAKGVKGKKGSKL